MSSISWWFDVSKSQWSYWEKITPWNTFCESWAVSSRVWCNIASRMFHFHDLKKKSVGPVINFLLIWRFEIPIVILRENHFMKHFLKVLSCVFFMDFMLHYWQDLSFSWPGGDIIFEIESNKGSESVLFHLVHHQQPRFKNISTNQFSWNSVASKCGRIFLW